MFDDVRAYNELSNAVSPYEGRDLLLALLRGGAKPETLAGQYQYMNPGAELGFKREQLGEQTRQFDQRSVLDALLGGLGAQTKVDVANIGAGPQYAKAYSDQGLWKALIGANAKRDVANINRESWANTVGARETGQNLRQDKMIGAKTGWEEGRQQTAKDIVSQKQAGAETLQGMRGSQALERQREALDAALQRALLLGDQKQAIAIMQMQHQLELLGQRHEYRLSELDVTGQQKKDLQASDQAFRGGEGEKNRALKQELVGTQGDTAREVAKIGATGRVDAATVGAESREKAAVAKGRAYTKNDIERATSGVMGLYKTAGQSPPKDANLRNQLARSYADFWLDNKRTPVSLEELTGALPPEHQKALKPNTGWFW